MTLIKGIMTVTKIKKALEMMKTIMMIKWIKINENKLMKKD